MKMARDVVRTEAVTLSPPVDSVHRRHRPQHALLAPMSIKARLRAVTGTPQRLWHSRRNARFGATSPRVLSVLMNSSHTSPSTEPVATRLIRYIQVTGAQLAISPVAVCTAAVATCLLAVALVSGLAVHEVPSSGTPAGSTTTAGNAQLPFLEHQIASKTPVLPAATVPPAAAPSSVATAAPLSPHEVFGFVPYWSLGQSAGFSVAGLTTLDYFSVGINPNGTLDESGAGWNGYESQALSTLITRAHGAGIRVVLTVNDFDQHSLDALTSNPTAATTLAKALIAAVQAKNLDGVNLDLEGSGNADQAGLTRLVTTVSDALHQVDSALAGDDGHLRLARPAIREASTTLRPWPAPSTDSSSWSTRPTSPPALRPTRPSPPHSSAIRRPSSSMRRRCRPTR